MKRAFDTYAWAGPLTLTPLAWWLWLWAGNGDRALALFAVALPIAHGYIVPAVGTNVLKVWSFTSRVRIGAFRPQHGFVFGSATAALTAILWLALPMHTGATVRIVATAVFLLGLNWVYDAMAIRHGVLVVRNQPAADGAGEWAVAGDYVVWFFGLFGALYAAVLDDAIRAGGAGLAWRFAAGLALTMLVPTACYIAASFVRHGHSGCRPIAPKAAA